MDLSLDKMIAASIDARSRLLDGGSPRKADAG